MHIPKWIILLALLAGAYVFGGLTVKYRLFPLKKKPAVIAQKKPKRKNVLAGEKLLTALREGGYIIYFRHAAREKDYTASIFAFESLMSVTRKEIRHPSFRYAVCLNEKGKAQSWLMRELFAELKIPIGKVVASPICRAMETAQEAFGRVDEIQSTLVHGPLQLEAQKAEFKRRKIAVLATKPASGKNTVIVAHGGGALKQAGLEVVDFNQSDAVVLKPLGGSNFEFVAQMTLLDWANLLERRSLEGVTVGK